MAIGLNRQERGAGERSAIQELEQDLGVTVLSIIDMPHLIQYLEQTGGEAAEALPAMRKYRQEYGV